MPITITLSATIALPRNKTLRASISGRRGSMVLLPPVPGCGPMPGAIGELGLRARVTLVIWPLQFLKAVAMLRFLTLSEFGFDHAHTISSPPEPVYL